MSNYQYLTCQEWDEKLSTTDPEMLTDDEIDAYNHHVATCSRCTSLLVDPELDAFIRENIPLEEVLVMLPQRTQESGTHDTLRKLRRTVFLGLGATGNEIVCRLKRDFAAHQFDTPLFQYCVIAEDESISNLTFESDTSVFLNIGHATRENTAQTNAAIAHWWGERNDSNLILDESVQQMRAIGRRHLFEHFDEVNIVLRKLVNATTNGMMHRQIASQGFELLDTPPVVYVVFSLSEATGSGLFLDIAYLVQHLFKSFVSPELVALAVLPNSRQIMEDSYARPQANVYAALHRLRANAYAAIQELEHYTKATTAWDVSYPSNVHISSTQAPFSSVYLVDSTNEQGETYAHEHVYEQIQRFLYCLGLPELGTSELQHGDRIHVGDILPRLTHSECIKYVRRDESDEASKGIGQLPIYSTFGISHARLDLQTERMRPQAEMFLYDQFLHQQVTSPTLPRFLRNAVILGNEVKKDVFSFNTYIPADKMLQLPQKLSSEGVLHEMETIKRSYEKALSDGKQDSQWQRVDMKYVVQASAAIISFIHTMLKEHGPVYVHQALEDISNRLQQVRHDLDGMHQEQIQDQKKHDWKFVAICEQWKTGSATAKDGRLALFRGMRYLSEREKQTIEKLLYNQYLSSVLEMLFKHVITHLFNSIMQFVEQQQALFADARSRLEEIYGQADSKEQQEDSIGFSRNVLQPRLDEQKHFDEAIISGEFNIEMMAHQALQEIYDQWPFDDDNDNGIVRLEECISKMITQALRDVGKNEHLAFRLQSPECASSRRNLIAESAYMVNFEDTAKRWLLPTLDTLHILNYGLRPLQEGNRYAIELALDNLSVELLAHPLLRLTVSENELTLMNIVHGFSLSSLRLFDELHDAYEFVIRTTYAPYLHFDIKNWEEVHLAPTRVFFTIDDLLDMWRPLHMHRVDLNDLFKPLENYYASSTAFIRVDEPDHPFFDVLANLRDAISSQLGGLPEKRKQTLQSTEALTILADMEALLFAQDWHKIDPPQYTLFNPQFHHRHLEDDTTWPANRKARIIELVSPGYIRQSAHVQHAPMLIRRAEVIVSTWHDDNQERPVATENRY